jgi:hypothetical protein
MVVPGVVIVAGLAVAVAFWQRRPRLRDADVDAAVATAIEQDSKATFLVTGALEVEAEADVDNTDGALDPEAGPMVKLRAPGRVEYGFDATKLTADRITLLKDGAIEVKVPQPVIDTVRPDLDRLEIQTTVGWSRLTATTAAKVQVRALSTLQDNMRMQAVQSMMASRQPDVSTADALYAMMRPSLVAAGMRAPRFRFLIGSNLVMEPRDR